MRWADSTPQQEYGNLTSHGRHAIAAGAIPARAVRMPDQRRAVQEWLQAAASAPRRVFSTSSKAATISSRVASAFRNFTVTLPPLAAYRVVSKVRDTLGRPVRPAGWTGP